MNELTEARAQRDELLDALKEYFAARLARGQPDGAHDVQAAEARLYELSRQTFPREVFDPETGCTIKPCHVCGSVERGIDRVEFHPPGDSPTKHYCSSACMFSDPTTPRLIRPSADRKPKVDRDAFPAPSPPLLDEDFRFGACGGDHFLKSKPAEYYLGDRGDPMLRMCRKCASAWRTGMFGRKLKPQRFDLKQPHCFVCLIGADEVDLEIDADGHRICTACR